MTFAWLETWLLVWYPSHLCFSYLWRYHRHVCDVPLAWLMCGWVISHAVPFYDYYYGHYDFEYMTLRLTLSKGRMGCNPRHVCLVDLTMTLSWLWGDWYCVLYMPFTTPGSWSLHPYDTWGHPSYYLVAWEVSPLIVRLWIEGLWLWDMTLSFGLVVEDYPIPSFLLFICLFLMIFPNALYFSSISLSLLCLCICSLGFLSSAAFPFPAAGFSRKLGYGKRVWLDLEDYALD